MCVELSADAAFPHMLLIKAQAGVGVGAEVTPTPGELVGEKQSSLLP